MRNLIGLLAVCYALLESTAFSAEEKRSAFLSHAYFCNETVTVDNTIQPDELIYEARSNYPGTSVTFVLTMLLNQGKHDISVKIVGPGNKVITTNDFTTLDVKQNYSIEVLKTTISGRLPTGGLKYVVTSRFNDSEKEVKQGEFFLRTVKL